MQELDDTILRRYLTTSRLIVAALILGVLIFLGIAVYMVEVRGQGQGMGGVPAGPPVLPLIAGALFAIQVPLSFILPAAMVGSSLRRLAADPTPTTPAQDAAHLLVLRQTSLILGMALLEGVALLGCIVYMLHGSQIAFGLVCLLVLLMLFRYPKEIGTRFWLETHLSRLEDMRTISRE